MPVWAQTQITAEQQTRLNLQKQIDDAIADGVASITITPGTYRVATSSTHEPFFKIVNARGLEIIADDVLLICTSLNRALHIENCEKLILRGLTVDYDPLPFTQGKVTQIAEDQTNFDVALCEGYPPVDLAMRVVCSVIDPLTFKIKTDTWSRYGGDYTKLSENMYNVNHHRPMIDAMAVGDYVVLNRQARVPHTIFLTRSNHCTLRNVTLLTSATFGFMESDCSSNHYDGLVIKPGPMPEGATLPRFLSSHADGFHSKHAKVGPLVENCNLQQMGDDGIAINGDFLLAMAMDMSSSQPTVDVIVKRDEIYTQVGDRVLGLKINTGVPMGQSKVMRVEKIDLPTDDILKARSQYLNRILRKDVFARTVYRLTLDRPIKIVPGDLLSCPDRNGSGFVVRHNVVGFNRARGLLIKASDGIIENNTIDQTFLAGIVLAPEIHNWMEADFSRNVIIRNNTIKGVNRTVGNPGYYFAGAISVTGSGAMPAGGQRNITIENNTITDTCGLAIQICSATDVNVANNQIIRPNIRASINGQRYGIPSNAVIYVDQSDKVMLRDNTIASPDPNLGEWLQTGKDAGIFANNGLTLKNN
jgi:hypothetical protein